MGSIFFFLGSDPRGARRSGVEDATDCEARMFTTALGSTNGVVTVMEVETISCSVSSRRPVAAVVAGTTEATIVVAR